ncbi:MAG TPA: YceI family protein [Bryobacteraceae bacterium]|nr:YceI family protein [Bryobacteraceae bacterium]
MMKRLIVTTLTFALCAGAADYQVHLTPENTQLRWTLGAVLHTVQGTFAMRRGEIAVNTETGKASGEVVVDATSGESGSKARDEKMHRDVLESARYPEISFVPDRLEGKIAPAGVSRIKLFGKLRIHGAEHEIAVPVEVRVNGQMLETDLHFDIPYVVWGMKDPSTLFLRVNKSVAIDLRASVHLAETVAVPSGAR